MLLLLLGECVKQANSVATQNMTPLDLPLEQVFVDSNDHTLYLI